MNETGEKVTLEISAVKVGVGEERAAVIFVDNRARIIYGQRYIDADKEELEARVRQFADDVMKNLRIAHQRETLLAMRDGRPYPLADATLRKMKEVITSTTREQEGT
jgi:hypothetical protein